MANSSFNTNASINTVINILEFIKEENTLQNLYVYVNHNARK